MPQFACERALPIHFHIHGALVVMEKLVGLVKVALVIHKHKVSYIIWHISTCALFMQLCNAYDASTYMHIFSTFFALKHLFLWRCNKKTSISFPIYPVVYVTLLYPCHQETHNCLQIRYLTLFIWNNNICHHQVEKFALLLTQLFDIFPHFE